MSFLDRFFPKRENRSAPKAARTSDPYLSEFFGFKGLGGAVTPENVLSNSSVAVRCISMRSELLASVPRHIFRRTNDGGRDRARDLSLYGVLHDIANASQSSFEFFELMIRCLDLHGNAFARIERNTRGQVVALWPLLPGVVTVERLKSGRLRYKVSDGHGGTETLLQDDVLHIRGPSRDGMMGMSPLTIARGSLCLAMAQRETATALMQNSLRPSGIISFPSPLTNENRDNTRNSINDRLTGPDKAGSFLILDGGAKYDQMALSPEDAQFVESMKLSNEDIARIFGVPPTAVGILDRGTYSNVEQEATSLIQNCLGPLAARIEAALTRCLLTEDARKTLYIEHDLSGLLRGDVKSRFEAYRIGREIGAMSANDVRKKENEPPVVGGDEYHQPANWVSLGTKPQAPGVA